MSRAADNAFTLFEVMLAVTIFALIAGAAFLMAGGSLTAGGELAARAAREEQLGGLAGLFQYTFRSLPPGARLSTAVALDGDKSRPEVSLYRIPGLLQSGRLSGVQNKATFSLRPESGGLLSLIVSYDHEDENNVNATRQDNKREVVLMRGIRSMQWRFYNPTINQWIAEWENKPGLPRMVEILVEIPEAEGVRTIRVWIPPLARQPDLTAPSDDIPAEGETTEDVTSQNPSENQKPSPSPINADVIP